MELLRAGPDSQLFLTVEEEGLREALVEVTLALESGQAASHQIQLRNGTGVWSLPAGMALEGTCSVQATVEG